jgi:hypothetical protein
MFFSMQTAEQKTMKNEEALHQQESSLLMCSALCNRDIIHQGIKLTNRKKVDPFLSPLALAIEAGSILKHFGSASNMTANERHLLCLLCKSSGSVVAL